MLDDRSDTSPIDVAHAWFDGYLVNTAEAYWRKRFSIQAPDLRKRPEPTAAEIADVERKANIARANIERFVMRSRRVFSPKRGADPVKRVRDAMGVWVRELPEAAE